MHLLKMRDGKIGVVFDHSGRKRKRERETVQRDFTKGEFLQVKKIAKKYFSQVLLFGQYLQS